MLRPRAQGFSLIELMIALALGAAVIASSITLLVSALGFNRDLMLTLRTQQDQRLLLDLGLRDAARAGHWRLAGVVASATQMHDLVLSADSGSVVATAMNPGTGQPAPAFAPPLLANVLVGSSMLASMRSADGSIRHYEMRVAARNSSTEITLDLGSQRLPVNRIVAGSWTLRNPFAGLTTESGCLVFAYDEDGDGVRGAQERYGYRYDRSAQALEGSNNTGQCNSGSWQNISDERVLRVSRFQVDARHRAVDSGNARPLRTTTIALGLSASPRASSAAALDLQGAMRARNDALQ